MPLAHKSVIASDGARIAYTDSGDGTPVVLLHGMAGHGGLWALQDRPLRDAGYRVIAVDLRFHGASDRPDRGYSVARLGQDVAELLRHEDLHDVALVGHSMGANVALAAISLHGTARVSRLVVVDQAPRIVNDATWEWGVRHVTWSRLEGQARGEVPWGELEREPVRPAEVTHALSGTGGAGNFTDVPLALRVDHFASDWRDVLPRLDRPVLVVTGAHSPFYPLEGMQWMQQALPDARLSVYDASGHEPHHNEYARFNRELLSFLASERFVSNNQEHRMTDQEDRMTDETHGHESGVSEQVLQTTRSWNDVEYEGYAPGTPQLTVTRFHIPAHSSLPWHTHPMPNAAYVISGAITVEERDTGRTRTITAGQAFGESVGSVHRGFTGDEPAEIVATYAGVPGQRLSVPQD